MRRSRQLNAIAQRNSQLSYDSSFDRMMDMKDKSHKLALQVGKLKYKYKEIKQKAKDSVDEGELTKYRKQIEHIGEKRKSVKPNQKNYEVEYKKLKTDLNYKSPQPSPDSLSLLALMETTKMITAISLPSSG